MKHNECFIDEILGSYIDTDSSYQEVMEAITDSGKMAINNAVGKMFLHATGPRRTGRNTTIPGPVDLEPITVPADEPIPDEAFNAEAVPVLEGEHIINDALTWLLPFMFSDDIILEPEFKHDCVISLTCRVDNESTETIDFYSDDPLSKCKKKLRKLVMNGWPVESFEQDGRLALNTVYLEKFFKALGTLGGTLDTSGGCLRFIPFADTSAYFWDLVGD